MSTKLNSDTLEIEITGMLELPDSKGSEEKTYHAFGFVNAIPFHIINNKYGWMYTLNPWTTKPIVETFLQVSTILNLEEFDKLVVNIVEFNTNFMVHR